jgi:hypothetical protein
MKIHIILASLLAFVLPASAQPASPPVENVIVTAPKLRPEEALNQFVLAHAAPSPRLQKVARWNTGICPVSLGLSAKLNQYISQRIVRFAMMAGAPLDGREPCHPNVAVLATDQPQVLLDFIRTKRPGLLGFHYKARAQALATMNLPVQAWYSTATQDFYGFLYADLPLLDANQQQPGAAGIPGGVHVSGFRNKGEGAGLKSQFGAAIILVDKTKIAGMEIGALGDYIAMLALSQGTSYDTCQEVPTITNLLAPGCAAELKPTALTDIDATYLRGLYKMDPAGSFMMERGSIAYQMKKELGGY